MDIAAPRLLHPTAARGLPVGAVGSNPPYAGSVNVYFDERRAPSRYLTHQSLQVKEQSG